MELTLALISLAIITFINPVVSLVDCDNVFTEDTSFVGSCNNKWSNLKSIIRRKFFFFAKTND